MTPLRPTTGILRKGSSESVSSSGKSVKFREPVVSRVAEMLKNEFRTKGLAAAFELAKGLGKGPRAVPALEAPPVRPGGLRRSNAKEHLQSREEIDEEDMYIELESFLEEGARLQAEDIAREYANFMSSSAVESSRKGLSMKQATQAKPGPEPNRRSADEVPTEPLPQGPDLELEPKTPARKNKRPVSNEAVPVRVEHGVSRARDPEVAGMSEAAEAEIEPEQQPKKKKTVEPEAAEAEIEPEKKKTKKKKTEESEAVVEAEIEPERTKTKKKKTEESEAAEAEIEPEQQPKKKKTESEAAEAETEKKTKKRRQWSPTQRRPRLRSRPRRRPRRKQKRSSARLKRRLM